MKLKLLYRPKRDYALAAMMVASVLAVGTYQPNYSIAAPTPDPNAPIYAAKIHAETYKAPKPDSAEDIKAVKDKLESSIKSANAKLEAGGKHMNSAGELKADIEHANYAIKAQRISGVASYDLERTQVDKSLETVTKELDAYRAEQARIAAQARARATGGTAVRRSDGTWTVNYRGTDDRRYANADGSMSEWKSGYYIAHDWSANGQAIASKPGTVRVNGRLYRYVSSIVVSRDTTWGQVSGFVYANGGIGFQTCYGNGYLITHYEPI